MHSTLLLSSLFSLSHFSRSQPLSTPSLLTKRIGGESQSALLNWYTDTEVDCPVPGANGNGISGSTSLINSNYVEIVTGSDPTIVPLAVQMDQPLQEGQSVEIRSTIPKYVLDNSKVDQTIDDPVCQYLVKTITPDVGCVTFSAQDNVQCARFVQG